MRTAVCVAILVAGCRGADRPTATIRFGPPSKVAANVTVSAETTAINASVAAIERYVRSHRNRIELFARVPGHASLVPVKDSTAWPEDADTTYNIVRDSAGRPMVYVASPVSESGDEDIETTYWFDPDGRTMLYEYYVGSFSSGCTEALHETKRVWLDHRGVPIARTSRYTDADGKPVQPEKCSRLSDTIPAPRLRAADLAVPPPRAE